MGLEKYKISFCTVCMNRLHHLQQTLLVNILNNHNYENLEFVLLDYNSDDGLDHFVKNTFSNFLSSKRLVYYKTTTPKYFNRSHSRNLIYKLATGDIICNIDADNYTGSEFAGYISDEFEKNEAIFLAALGNSTINGNTDVFGRTCVKRRDFYNVKGYDERMVNYGFEDYDFYNRLKMSGLSSRSIRHDFLKAISHDENERLSNEFISKNLYSLLVNYLTPSSTDFLFLFNDNTYTRGIIINNSTFKHSEPMAMLRRAQLKYTNSILQDEWIEGIWETKKNKLILMENDTCKEEIFINMRGDCFASDCDNGSTGFYKILNPDLIQEAVMVLSQITNRIIMERNILEQNVVTNTDGFGKDVVYKNFDYQNPIVT